MKNIRFPYAPAVVWGIFIFVLSVLPGKDFPVVPNWGDLLSLDKIVHIIFYGFLTWLILWGKQQNTAQKPQNRGLQQVSLLFIGFVILFSSSLGWFLEWLQGAYCQDRMFDVMDGIANTLGSAIAALAFRFVKDMGERRKIVK